MKEAVQKKADVKSTPETKSEKRAVARETFTDPEMNAVTVDTAICLSPDNEDRTRAIGIDTPFDPVDND